MTDMDRNEGNQLARMPTESGRFRTSTATVGRKRRIDAILNNYATGWSPAVSNQAGTSNNAEGEAVDGRQARRPHPTRSVTMFCIVGYWPNPPRSMDGDRSRYQPMIYTRTVDPQGGGKAENLRSCPFILPGRRSSIRCRTMQTITAVIEKARGWFPFRPPKDRRKIPSRSSRDGRLGCRRRSPPSARGSRSRPPSLPPWRIRGDCARRRLVIARIYRR
jgi:hypothetical protein